MFNLEKLIEYGAPAVKEVSSIPFVESRPRTKISFYLLLICTDELIPTTKIMSFLPILPFEKSLNTITTIYAFIWIGNFS